jgi:UDP-N-acetylmuramate dehydrogenase
MKFEENRSLQPYNTFGIEARAHWYASFGNADELGELLATKPGALAAPPSGPVLFLVLGGGSNILFTGDFDGLVLKNEIKGIELIREDEHYVYVRAGAGENWHSFVRYCLQRNWGGVENLSLIPGNVGASPMQNIGAYGVEIRDCFYELEAWSLREKKVYSFSLNDCEFGYRDSVFKRRYKDQFVILHVVYRLNKVPRFHTEYGAIREELDKMGIRELSIQAISEAVIRIRSSKLPDPKEIGNAGSFFKNPVVSAGKWEALKVEFPGIIGYPGAPVESPDPAADSDASPGDRKGKAGGGASVKLAAGWLIESCGWKGYRKDDAGVHARQALVLVNYGHASGVELFGLSEEILQSVKQKFGVELEREVNII